jgi:hypothetical protein
MARLPVNILAPVNTQEVVAILLNVFMKFLHVEVCSGSMCVCPWCGTQSLKGFLP